MAVYDDQDTKTRPERIEEADLRNITGISPDDESKMEKSAYSGAAEDIAEKNDLNINTNKLSKNSKDKPKIQKNKGIIGGFIATLVVSGGISIGTIISGPLQILHFSKFIDFNFMSRGSNTMDISARRLYNTMTGSREKNRLGILASTLTQRNINKLQTGGIELSFETANGKGRTKLQAITIDPTTSQGKSLLGRVQVEGIDLPSPDINGKITLRSELRGRDGGPLMRSMADHMIDINGKKGISGAMAKRRMKKLFRADFHPMSIARRQGESIIDSIKRGHTERAERNRDGTKDKFINPSGHTDPETDIKTSVDPDVDNESKLTKELVDDLKGKSKSSKLKSIKANNLLKTGAAAGTAAVAIICSVKDIGDNVSEYKMLNIIKPLIRLSTSYLANGSKIQSMENFNLTELGSMSYALYDTETNTSWASAKEVQETLGNTGGKPLDLDIKDQITGAYSGDKPMIFSALDSIPTLGTVCGAYNGVTGWIIGLPILSQISSVTDRVVQSLSSGITGKSVDEWMTELISAISGEAIDTLSRGSTLGSLAAYGSKISANSSLIAMGGSELSTEQVMEWNEYDDSLDKIAISQQSIKERLFEISSLNSLSGQLAMSIYSSPHFNSVGSMAQTGLLSILSNVQSSIFSIITPKTQAQANLGLPTYGIPLSTLNSARYEDVFENFDRLEEDNFSKLISANSKWGDCFGRPLDDSGNIIDKEADAESHEKMINCQDSVKGLVDNELTDYTDYYMYILDNVNVKTEACYEGIDDEACEELGLGSSNTTQSSDSGETGTTDQVNKDEDTSNLSCPEGTVDGGVHQDYGPGRVPTVKVRICNIGRVRGVNASAAGNALRMITDANNAGLEKHTVGSAYRSYDKQAELRVTNGCTNSGCRIPTAKPGNSMHELGLAIDFENMCFGRGNTTCRSNPLWVWLTENASNYGFKQLSSEAWHWSINGN